ncbi:hypothetical protein HY310_02960, partial [Candidatus Microgenomates bacterium]|nr:hypothetical protein [Candidatus Microgenomates bacterium]
MKILKKMGSIFFFLFCALILLFSLRGLLGNPTSKDLNDLSWKDNGPLELSPERGRYALLYSIVEDHSFTFSTDIARFTAPDVAYTPDKRYVSLFAPSLSFLVIPGYIIGKSFGVAQVGAFAMVALFALLNTILIRAIAIRLGANSLAATLASFTFLFATPAFTYAVTLYQHHISTFLILLAVYLLVRFNTVASLAVIWFLCALSITVDYPNLFMMLPIGLVALVRTLLIEKHEHAITMKIPLLRIVALGSMIIPLAFFLWFNAVSYHNPFTISGTLERAVEIKPDGTPLFERDVLKKLQGEVIEPIVIDSSLMNAFRNRNAINGMYTLFISPDRGIIYYTPIMLFGILGLVLALKNKQKYAGLLIAIIGFNVLVYSMWGDAYGGWAFGARYLIPSYAILSIFIAFFLTYYKRSLIVSILFFVVLSYSLFINTVGAITSSKNPPKVEIAELEKQTHTVQE